MNGIRSRPGVIGLRFAAVVAFCLPLSTPIHADVRYLGSPAQQAAYAARWKGLYSLPLGSRQPGWGVGNFPDGPLVGQYRGVCLLVRFRPDADHDLQHDIPFYNNLFHGPDNPESFRKVFLEESNNQFDITIDTYGWFTLASKASLDFTFSGDPADDMVAAAIQAADPTVDFSQYDSDHNGIIDFLVIVHAAVDGSTLDTEALAYGGPWVSGYSSVAAILGTGPSSVPTNDGVAADTFTQWNEVWATRAGVIAHEFCHTMGAADLYDTSFTQTFNFGPVGIWSLMGRGIYTEEPTVPLGLGAFFVTGRGWPGIAMHLDPWHKMQLGWIRKENGTLVDVSPGQIAAHISSVESSPKVYRVFPNGDPTADEYFLIERRSQTGLDLPLPAEGLLIWHIDKKVVFDNYALNEVENDLTHLGVAVVQADGRHDLEQAMGNLNFGTGNPPVLTSGNLGDAGDVWPGSTKNVRFVPSTDANPSPVPNSPTSDDYNGNSTGLSVTDIDNAANATTATITLDVTYNPTVTIVTPLANQQVVNFTPTIQAQFSESHPSPPGFDPTQMTIEIDGEEVVSSARGNVEFDPVTNLLTYTCVPLAQGTHTVRVTGMDLKGNVAHGHDQLGNRADYDEVRFVVTPKAIPAGVRMISVPFNLTHATPGFVLSDPAPAFARWDARTNLYHTFVTNPTDPFVSSLSPGRGYWVKLASQVALQLRGTDVPRERYELTFESANSDGTLPAGWYQIATPFPFTIDFSSLQVEYKGVPLSLSQAIDDEVVGPALYHYRNGAYSFAVAPAGALEPFDGYWVHVLKPEVRLFVLPLPSGRAKSPTDSHLAGAGWLVRLAATTEAGRDGANFFGVSSVASDGRGRFDVEEPPPPAGTIPPVSVSFVRTRGTRTPVYYAQEVRHGPLSRPQTWNVVVQAPARENVSLTWSDLANVPAEVRLTLFDPLTGKRLYMRTTRAYTFNVGTRSRRELQVTAAPDSTGWLRVSHVHVQPSRGGAVTIAFQVSQPATSQVVIRSATGRVIRRLPPLAHGRGLVTRQWNGRDGSGRVAPKGLYTCEIVARTDENQIARTLSPFALTH